MALPKEILKEFQGYRRSIHIESNGEDVAFAELEDDIHAFAVTIHHDGCEVISIDVDIRRAPWSTCPGAKAVLQRDIVGLKLKEVRKYPDKIQQCTHLMDLATWAAGYAAQNITVDYDVLVTDAKNGVRHAEIWRDGEFQISWDESKFILLEPSEIAGLNLFQINDWLKTLTPDLQEAVRILRWGNMIANGRAMSLEAQSDATKMPANCYSFQPERAIEAKRVGVIRDFSFGKEIPLS